MANVPEQPVYDAGVYEYEVTDPVQGGLGGIANAPLTNLANRTAYLKQRLDALINGSIIPPTVAPLNGAAFTGSTTAPNVAPGDDSTLIANTDFVQTAKHGLVTVNVGGSSNVTLVQSQWGCAMIEFFGVLTNNISIIFPSQPGNWIVANGCTGTVGGSPATLTLRLAGGGGNVVLNQFPNQFNAIWTDGVGVYPQVSPFLLTLTQALVIAALGFTPVQQGGGTNQGTDKVYIGYDQAQNGRIRLQVNATDFGDIAMQTDVQFEANARFAADQAEANTRSAGDVNAQNQLNAEIATRFANDNAEITARVNGDNTEITQRFNADQAILNYVNGNCAILASNQVFTGANHFSSAMFPEAGMQVGTLSNPISHGSNGFQVLADGTTQVSNQGLTPLSVGCSFVGPLISFFNGATAIATIVNVGASVAYNTTCDYRIKIVHGMVDEDEIGAIFDATPVRDAEFKEGGVRRPMFLAHELAEGGAPSLVTGDKDAEQDIGDLVTIAKDGDEIISTVRGVPEPVHLGDDQTWTKTGRGPVLQQVDHPAAVPYLWAEIRFLREREKARAARERVLEARLAALEARV